MKKEFKAVYENIKPDEELLMNAFDFTTATTARSW